MGLWEKYYDTLFGITHYFSSDVGFTNIVVQSTAQSGAETKYRVSIVRGQCKDRVSSISISKLNVNVYVYSLISP